MRESKQPGLPNGLTTAFRYCCGSTPIASRARSPATGKIVTDRTYLKVFHPARSAAFTETEAASLAARRPYDLRHAAVSTWLRATADPAQVAEWAGHTVDVLMRVYAKCVSGQQDQAKRRILEATRPAAVPSMSEHGD